MSPVRKKMMAVLTLAAVAVFATAALAYAAPTIGIGQGWSDGHGSNPGYCLNCHNGWARQPGQITQGVAATHRDRGSSCTQCHTVVNPPQPPRVPVTTVKGGTRYLTAIEVSENSFPTTAPAVVLATGANFPDALCAAPLAKAFGGPILLTAPQATLTTEVLAEVNRLKPARVFIVGSDAVVAAGIETQVKALAFRPAVTRLAGGNRYETAAAVAAEVKAKLGTTSQIVLANGQNYPDALAAAPLAAAKGWPILLTQANALPAATASAVASCAPSATLVCGGPNVVSDAVKNQMPGAIRKGGGTRYETNGLIADYAVSQGMNYGTLVTTVGNNYPDALTAGPMVAKRNGILLLTEPTAVPKAISDRMTINKMSVSSMVVVGGAVQSGCLNLMNTYLR